PTNQFDNEKIKYKICPNPFNLIPCLLFVVFTVNNPIVLFNLAIIFLHQFNLSSMKKHFMLLLVTLFFSVSSFAIGPIMGPRQICVGDHVTLFDTTAGGFWSSSDTSIAR